MKDVFCRPIAMTELNALAIALRQNGLPADDISAPGRKFWHFRNSAEATIGFGGLEIYGSLALLRSIVVMPAMQRQGMGQKIVHQLLRNAGDMGITKIYLLTTTAQAFFEAQGFKVIERMNVPVEILATRQAAQLCPGSAVILMKEIDDYSH